MYGVHKSLHENPVESEARKDLGWMAVLGYSLSTVSVALYALPGSHW